MKPTITELTQLLDKPKLLEWANRLGLSGKSLSEYRKERKQRGTNLHEQIKDFLTSGVKMESEFHQKYLEEFLQGRKVIGVEENVECEDYRGRYDILIEEKDGLYVCDFKSGNRVYPETILQLVGYRQCFEEKPKIAVVEIPAFKVKPLDIIEYAPYTDILHSLSTIWRCKKEIGI